MLSTALISYMTTSIFLNRDFDFACHNEFYYLSQKVLKKNSDPSQATHVTWLLSFFRMSHGFLKFSLTETWTL